MKRKKRKGKHSRAAGNKKIKKIKREQGRAAAGDYKMKKSKGEPDDRASAWIMKRDKSKWKQGRAAGNMKRKKSKGEQEDRATAGVIRKRRVMGNKAEQQRIQKEKED